MTEMDRQLKEAEESEVEDASNVTKMEGRPEEEEDASHVNRMEEQEEMEEAKVEDASNMAEIKGQPKEVEDVLNTTEMEGQGKEVEHAELEEDPNLTDIEGQHKEVEDTELEAEENDSDDSFIDDSDGEEPYTFDNDHETIVEAPMTDAEIEELVADFLEVESKAAEAQESLEKESLAQVEREVRAELAQNLEGDDLEMAVSTEMKTFVEEWEKALDDLEAESALLLEQLDGAGIELPKLYKWIESQAPNGCCTEAWKRRTLWVGSQATNEIAESIADAEKYLQSCRPVRRQRGRLVEEGASGYLGRKLSIEDNGDAPKEILEKDWSSFNDLIQSHKASDTSFGGKHWASVYLASTPQQAARLGLKLPGVDEVEEIDDIECTSSDPFYADALANEKDIDLSEEQKRNFRKVKEEDDANAARKLQINLKQRRRRNRCCQDNIKKEVSLVDRIVESELCDSMSLDESSHLVSVEKDSSETCEGARNINNKNISVQNKAEMIDTNGASGNLNKEKKLVNGTSSVLATCASSDSSELRGSKRAHDGEDFEIDNKRSRTVVIDSDDEVRQEEHSASCNDPNMVGDSALQAKEAVDTVDATAHPSLSPAGSGFDVTEDSKNFHCTACSKVLGAKEVHRHPLLEVIICGNCKDMLEEKMQQKDPDCSEGYCGWCGSCNDLVTCKLCKSLFCTKCIRRNFGEERLSEIQTSGWSCCCCSPSLLHPFILECDKALKIDSQAVSSSDSDSEQSDAGGNVPRSNKKRRKRRIRRILDDAELGEETKRKIALEKARQEHLKSMQVQFAGKSWGKISTSCNGNATVGTSVKVLGDATNGFIVNVAREADEVPVRIPPSISAKLKPHQIAGIRFMWENIIQSVKKVKSGDKGLGCILAHTMGLGKTLQVIAFLYTAMRGIDLGLRTALIVTPVNVLHNWRHEFDKWKPGELKRLRIFMLEDVPRERRLERLMTWRAKGGVFLIGYTAFRNLSLGKHVRDKNTAIEMCQALQNGPDVVVCDEAHMIKNTRADITYALKQVKCQRRIALTGSPLQNNLMEYYCMVDFVREGFLGSSHEFRNRFQNPIENGQHTNSTSDDVKIMNQRSHILYEQLKGFVQRMDMNVVKKDLPPKIVFVITVKLSALQRKLYKRFLDAHGFTGSNESSIRRRCFFAGYQALAQIWNHPGLLQMAKEHKDSLRREHAVENFVVDDSSSDDNIDRDMLNGERPRSKNDFAQKRNDNGFFREEIDWWRDLLHERTYRHADYSGKMVLLLEILSMSSEVGDKALVFSQSLTTLDLIELFLSKLPRKGREGKYWKPGKDWYRLDGSTEGSERQKLVERFNEPKNKRVKCILISTRAGSLGINLHAANRVIIVDGSWNPTYDLQAIYRVWRYGQTKPVYAYRLMAHGTMEEKIYKRQVTKEGLAARVVDRQQIHRTMSKEEVLHLFDFGDEESADLEEGLLSSDIDVGGSLKPKPMHPSKLSCSSDKFMESLLSRHYPRWIANYHEHETLLQENEEERLSKEEQDMAWETFQRTMEWEEVNRVSIDGSALFDQRPTGDILRSMVEDKLTLTKSSLRSQTIPRKCTSLAHLLTLTSQGTKPGSSTICGECSLEISWEKLHRDGKLR
ncbi:protein CHROMATIN REMODELING 20 isoform X2 [Magnolia sinica]|uniref:protein CHROMATIN REMODELING 20 isoform X2 n=1 Tax=Magnolia sinica TaxID=86752 RepID=UPI002659D795|nr:protein CHROMATIN REMODELING 20 isoform X2 [Magnolia sinica]